MKISGELLSGNQQKMLQKLSSANYNDKEDEDEGIKVEKDFYQECFEK